MNSKTYKFLAEIRLSVLNKKPSICAADIEDLEELKRTLSNGEYKDEEKIKKIDNILKTKPLQKETKLKNN